MPEQTAGAVDLFGAPVSDDISGQILVVGGGLLM